MKSKINRQLNTYVKLDVLVRARKFYVNVYDWLVITD